MKTFIKNINNKKIILIVSFVFLFSNFVFADGGDQWFFFEFDVKAGYYNGHSESRKSEKEVIRGHADTLILGSELLLTFRNDAKIGIGMEGIVMEGQIYNYTTSSDEFRYIYSVPIFITFQIPLKVLDEGIDTKNGIHSIPSATFAKFNYGCDIVNSANDYIAFGVGLDLGPFILTAMIVPGKSKGDYQYHGLYATLGFRFVV
jgi:hypothetical protein